MIRPLYSYGAPSKNFLFYDVTYDSSELQNPFNQSELRMLHLSDISDQTLNKKKTEKKILSIYGAI